MNSLKMGVLIAVFVGIVAFVWYQQMKIDRLEGRVKTLQVEAIYQKGVFKAKNFETKWRYIEPKEVKRETDTTVGDHVIDL